MLAATRVSGGCERPSRGRGTQLNGGGPDEPPPTGSPPGIRWDARLTAVRLPFRAGAPASGCKRYGERLVGKAARLSIRTPQRADAQDISLWEYGAELEQRGTGGMGPDMRVVCSADSLRTDC